MKFDHIIGNPPYQNNSAKGSNKKLWKDITNKMYNLFKESLNFITPDTQMQYLRKQYPENTKYIDYSANNYFNVGVKIISWQINKNKQNPIIINSDNTIEKITNHFMWYPKESRKLHKKFTNLKNTKPENRMFLRQCCGKGNLKCIKNLNKNTFDICEKYIIPENHKKLVISTSKSLKIENILETYDNFGSLYVMLDIENMPKDKIKKVKDFLLHPIFKKYCDTFRKTYGTGFNNVLIYMPKLNLDKELKDLLIDYKITQ